MLLDILQSTKQPPLQRNRNSVRVRNPGPDSKLLKKGFITSSFAFPTVPNSVLYMVIAKLIFFDLMKQYKFWKKIRSPEEWHLIWFYSSVRGRVHSRSASVCGRSHGFPIPAGFHRLTWSQGTADRLRGSPEHRR